MRLSGIPDLVDHLHRRIHSSVVTDGILGAGDVVVNGPGKPHAGDAHGRQVSGAPERAVAADHDQTVHADLFTHGLRL